jgi:hypothetical protein
MVKKSSKKRIDAKKKLIQKLINQNLIKINIGSNKRPFNKRLKEENKEKFDQQQLKNLIPNYPRFYYNFNNPGREIQKNITLQDILNNNPNLITQVSDILQNRNRIGEPIPQREQISKTETKYKTPLKTEKKKFSFSSFLSRKKDSSNASIVDSLLTTPETMEKEVRPDEVIFPIQEGKDEEESLKSFDSVENPQLFTDPYDDTRLLDSKGKTIYSRTSSIGGLSSASKFFKSFLKKPQQEEQEEEKVMDEVPGILDSTTLTSRKRPLKQLSDIEIIRGIKQTLKNRDDIETIELADMIYRDIHNGKRRRGRKLKFSGQPEMDVEEEEWAKSEKDKTSALRYIDSQRNKNKKEILIKAYQYLHK